MRFNKDAVCERCLRNENKLCKIDRRRPISYKEKCKMAKIESNRREELRKKIYKYIRDLPKGGRAKICNSEQMSIVEDFIREFGYEEGVFLSESRTYVIKRRTLNEDFEVNKKN